MMKKMFKILTPVERNGVTHWTKLGVGFPNKDDSINLYLDGFPANGKLQLREVDEEDLRRDRERGPRGTPVPATGTADDLAF